MFSLRAPLKTVNQKPYAPAEKCLQRLKKGQNPQRPEPVLGLRGVSVRAINAQNSNCEMPYRPKF